MKTITIDNNASVYIFNDDRDVTIGSDGTTVGADSNDLIKKVAYNISDMTTSSATMHTGVSETKSSVEYLKGTSVKVSDWYAHRYLYDGSAWTPNPNYVHIVRCEQIVDGSPCQSRYHSTIIMDRKGTDDPSDDELSFTLETIPTVCERCGKNIDGT